MSCIPYILPVCPHPAPHISSRPLAQFLCEREISDDFLFFALSPFDGSTGPGIDAPSPPQLIVGHHHRAGHGSEVDGCHTSFRNPCDQVQPKRVNFL